MNKRVLGIIAILCLDLALLWFIRGSFQPEEFVHISKLPDPVLVPSIPKLFVPKKQEIVEYKEASAHKEFATNVFSRKVTSKPRLDTSSTNRRETKKIATPPSSTYAVHNTEFKDTIIWIKKPAVENVVSPERLAVTDSPAKPIADIRPIKKSVFSRAVPIIKKPYLWLKSLVSKL